MQFKSEIDVRPIQQMGGDYMVVAAAKVSTNGTQAEALGRQLPCLNATETPCRSRMDYECENCKVNRELTEGNAGLINYLMKHRHGTPFEHSAMTFFVHAPIFVWREWHRHRIGFSYNEESGRYKKLEPIFYLPPKSRPMFKVDAWKPGRPKFLRYDEVDGGMHGQVEAEAKYQRFIERKMAQYKSAYASYEESLADGFDPGLARIDLPVGIYSGCWVTCNPRSLMAFLSLRVHEPEATFVSYPLYEIDEAARSCEVALRVGWPLTHAAFVKNGRVAP